MIPHLVTASPSPKRPDKHGDRGVGAGLVKKRPDLAEKVAIGDPTLTNALRIAKNESLTDRGRYDHSPGRYSHRYRPLETRMNPATWTVWTVFLPYYLRGQLFEFFLSNCSVHGFCFHASPLRSCTHAHARPRPHHGCPPPSQAAPRPPPAVARRHPARPARRPQRGLGCHVTL